MTNHRPFLSRSARLCRMFLCVLFAACAVAAAPPTGSVADLDRDAGLPGAPIGAPLQSFNGLKQIEDTGRWLSYVRPADRLEFQGVPVKAITYNFFKEKLYSINLDVSGRGDTHRMLKMLEQRYGSDHSFDTRAYAKVRAEMEVREWAGTKLYCIFKSSSEFDGGVLTLLDKPTWDQLQVPKREKEAQSRAMLKSSFSNGDF